MFGDPGYNKKKKETASDKNKFLIILFSFGVVQG